MRRALIIGCNALELAAGGITVHRANGSETIAWQDVTAAALAGRDRHMIHMAETVAARTGPLRPMLESQGVLGDLVRKTMELRETHDTLLIAHGAGVVYALIEQSGPQREALLAGLQTNLGGRWLGEEFTGREFEQRFGSKNSGCSLKSLGCVSVLIGGLPFLVFGWLLAVAVPGATAETLVDALFAGDWKSALIALAALAVMLFVYWAVKLAAGHVTGFIRGRLK